MASAGNIRAIKRQIRAVGNIKKITRAMQMVSAAKLRKVQERLLAIRPYSDKIQEMLERLSCRAKELHHPLFTPRTEVRRVSYVLMMSDKGLCGSYNSNMARYALRFITEKAKPYEATAVGRKAVDFFRKQGAEIKSSHVQLPTEVPFTKIQRMTQSLVNGFLSGDVDEVYLLYTKYVNAMTFTPGFVRFLPIEPPSKEEASEEELIFEPEPDKILDQLVPRYSEVALHRLLLESFSSEHAARMNAMQNATKNAQEMIESLTMIYNKARQAGITKELLDIVGGAEALKG